MEGNTHSPHIWLGGSYRLFRHVVNLNNVICIVALHGCCTFVGYQMPCPSPSYSNLYHVKLAMK